MPPTTIYTPENCNFAYQLCWGMSLFWKSPIFSDEWLQALREVTEPDGIRILEHRFVSPTCSQFLTSTLPETKPSLIIKSIKGRLQYLVRVDRPRPFQMNYDLRSIGSTQLKKVEYYIAHQLEHHSRDDASLVDLQFSDPEVNLSQPRYTAHGRYSCNLHLVFARAVRESEPSLEKLLGVRAIVRKASSKRQHLLSRLGILRDHLHLTVGVGLDESPRDIALSYMNNIAYTYGMRDVLTYSGYIGGVGEYDLGVVRGRSVGDGA